MGEDNATVEVVSGVIDEAHPPTANADALIAKAVQDMGGNPASAPPPPPPGTVEGFDAELHEADASGNPVLNVDGSLRRRRGRKPARGPGGKFAAAADAPPMEIPADSPPPPPGPAAGVDGAAGEGGGMGGGGDLSHETAMVTARHFVGIALAGAQSLFGEEWKPDSDSELSMLENAVGEYLHYKQFGGLTPGWVVLLMGGMFIGKRIQKPKTKTVLSALVAKIKARFRRG